MGFMVEPILQSKVVQEFMVMMEGMQIITPVIFWVMYMSRPAPAIQVNSDLVQKYNCVLELEIVIARPLGGP